MIKQNPNSLGTSSDLIWSVVLQSPLCLLFLGPTAKGSPGLLGVATLPLKIEDTGDGSSSFSSSFSSSCCDRVQPLPLISSAGQQVGSILAAARIVDCVANAHKPEANSQASNLAAARVVDCLSSAQKSDANGQGSRLAAARVVNCFPSSHKSEANSQIAKSASQAATPQPEGDAETSKAVACAVEPAAATRASASLAENICAALQTDTTEGQSHLDEPLIETQQLLSEPSVRAMQADSTGALPVAAVDSSSSQQPAQQAHFIVHAPQAQGTSSGHDTISLPADDSNLTKHYVSAQGNTAAADALSAPDFHLPSSPSINLLQPAHHSIRPPAPVINISQPIIHVHVPAPASASGAARQQLLLPQSSQQQLQQHAQSAAEIKTNSSDMFQPQHDTAERLVSLPAADSGAVCKQQLLSQSSRQQLQQHAQSAAEIRTISSDMLRPQHDTAEIYASLPAGKVSAQMGDVDTSSAGNADDMGRHEDHSVGTDIAVAKQAEQSADEGDEIDDFDLWCPATAVPLPGNSFGIGFDQGNHSCSQLDGWRSRGQQQAGVPDKAAMAGQHSQMCPGAHLSLEKSSQEHCCHKVCWAFPFC